MPRFYSTLVIAALLYCGCARTGENKGAGPSTADTVVSTAPAVTPAPTTPVFVGQTWRVVKSDGVVAGQTYYFRADSVLVIITPGSKPAMGRWSYRDGKLVLTEESQSYPTDILKSSTDSLTIRMHNPGGATDIEMVAE